MSDAIHAANLAQAAADEQTDTDDMCTATGAMPIEIDGQPWTATPVEIDTDDQQPADEDDPDPEGLRRSVERELSERAADEDPDAPRVGTATSKYVPPAGSGYGPGFLT